MSNKQLSPFGRSAFGRAGDSEGLAGLRRQMERMFEDVTRDWSLPSLWHQNGLALPKVDLVETDSGLELIADLPGVDPKDISLELDEDALSLVAHHSSEHREEDAKRHYHLVERAQGRYERHFTLPFRPDADAVQADFDKGVLKVLLPRSQKDAAQRHKIAVNPRSSAGSQKPAAP